MSDIPLLTVNDIDGYIRTFSRHPDRSLYDTIGEWYTHHINVDPSSSDPELDAQTTTPDRDYLVCVYVFLIAANIKHGYQAYESKVDYQRDVSQIRDAITFADQSVQSRRKAYMDAGLGKVQLR